MKTLPLLRAGYGVFLLGDPQRALRVAKTERRETSSGSIVRVLGARHLLQAAVRARCPTPTVGRLGACVDGLHAATDIAVACVDRRWRRAAVIDAAVAISFAVITLTTTS